MPSVLPTECGFDRRVGGQNHGHEIARWAQTRFGLISRPKLLALGLSGDDVDGRLAAASLLPTPIDGVYYVGHRSGVPGQQEALALAGSGPRAALDGVSAAAWRRMTDPWHGPVHIAVGPGRTAELEGVRRHRRDLRPREVTIVRGLACVVPERAVLDLPPERLRQALQWLVKRGARLEPIVERMHGRRGAKAFRAEVAQLVPQMAHTMSELEDRFLRLCVRFGIPLPEVNATRGHNGDLLDCTWPGSPVVVELDGRIWHEHRWQQDRERDRARALERRIPVRYGWDDVVRDHARTAGEIAELVAR